MATDQYDRVFGGAELLQRDQGPAGDQGHRHAVQLGEGMQRWHGPEDRRGVHRFVSQRRQRAVEIDTDQEVAHVT